MNVPDLSTDGVGGIRWLQAAHSHLIRIIAHMRTTSKLFHQSVRQRPGLSIRLSGFGGPIQASCPKGKLVIHVLHCTTVHAVARLLRTTRSRLAVIFTESLDTADGFSYDTSLVCLKPRIEKLHQSPSQWPRHCLAIKKPFL
jgi:hypothetical protein